MPDHSTGFAKGVPPYGRFLLAMFGAGFATYAQIFGAQGLLSYIAASERVSAADASLALSTASLGMAIGVLPWTIVADRYGRVRAMTISLALSSVLGILAPLIIPYGGFLGVRFLTGLALAAVPAVAMAYVTEVVSPRWIGAAAGTFVAGNSIGGIAGRVVAGAVAAVTDWRLALGCVGILAVVSSVLFVVVLPRHPDSVADRVQPESFLRRVLIQFRDPLMVAFFIQGFLLMGVFGAMYNYLSFRLAGAPFDIPPLPLSFIFIVYLAGTGSAKCSGWFTHRLGVLGAIQTSIATMLVGVLLTLSGNLAIVLIGLVLFTMGCFVAQPIAGSQCAQHAVIGRAQASALYQLSWLAGTALFGWFGGVVYQDAGWGGEVVMFSILLVTASLVCVVGLTWGRRHRPVVA